MSEKPKPPPINDWVERCRRADRQRAHDRAVKKGVPEVEPKVKK